MIQEDNEQLVALFAEDRSDTLTFRGAESFLASQPRRALAQRMVEQGMVRTADDYYHAAMLLQHGEKLEHWQQARELAIKAAEMGHPRARYLAAAALDRWLMRQGKPQKYGTNSWPDKDGWRVWDYDPTTTDEERAEWDVPPLAELLERAKELAGGCTPAETANDPIGTVEYEGKRIVLFSWYPEEPAGNPPPYIISPPGDPSPHDWPDGMVGSWRFGPLWCGKGADDVPCVTWRYCRWKPEGERVSERDVERFARAMGDEPIWLNEEGRVWSRVARRIPSGGCWLVGGSLPRPDLLRVIGSLHP
jgi:ribosomal 50S subunit-recycling heat shock protein